MNPWTTSRPLLASLALALAGSCAPERKREGDEITVGLLLPFTGSSSATGSNFERAVLFAADRINAGGGIQGRTLRVVSRDTHSELARSRKAAEQLIDQGASVVLGAESADIARALLPTFREAEVVFMSPLIGAAGNDEGDCAHPWYRLAPSAGALGEALGKLLFTQQIGRVAVLYAEGAYDEALAHAVSDRFRRLGGEVVLEAQLDPNAQSYGESIRKVEAAEVDAVVLATPPRTGALVINEYHAVSDALPRWFLSPLLKTEVFVQNVDPRAIEGALGVAPKVHAMGGEFAAAFAERWLGDEPLEGAYFYFDAMGLLALALEKSVIDESGKADRDSLEQGMIEAAAPPGEAVSWKELELGLERLSEGDDMYYSGLTGPMLLDRCGPRLLGITNTWVIEDGAIVQVESE